MQAIGERPWWPSDQQQFREALRYWIDSNLDTALTVREWWRRLADAGLTAPTWPRAHGGLAATTAVQQIVEDGLAAAGAVAPPVDNVGFRAVAPALRQFLPVDQLAAWLAPLLRGEHSWTLLLAEPDTADDTLRCRAERDWKYVTIDGAKRLDDPTASHGILVARSDPHSASLTGLDCYLVDLREPGIERLAGEVRFEAHRFLHDRLLGRQGGGWEIVKHMQPYLERTLAGRIRRGLVRVPVGELAGALDLTLAEAIAAFPPDPLPPAEERRRR